MKVLLVYPGRLDQDGNKIRYKKAFLPPLSLAILNGLTPDKHKVDIVNDIVEPINYDVKYDLVGITAMTTQIGRAYQIADKFRSIGVPVILGGMHPTVLPAEAKLHADTVVIGEADNLWEGILKDCLHDELKDFYQDSTFPDLQELIIPKWDNFNMKIYPKQLGNKLPMMPIYTTRGCPLGCKFCSVTKYFGSSFRTKPIEHVLKEIEHTGGSDFFFVDDNIAANVDYARELFDALPSSRIHWFSQISTRVLQHPELIELAGKAGCKALFIGLESISKASLDSVKKGFNDTNAYEELFERIKKAGIVPMPSIIFGFDHDSLEQFDTTLQFLRKNKIGFASFWILTPIPGTDLFDEMEEQKRILSRDWSLYDVTHVVFEPKLMKVEELYDNYWKTYRRFFNRSGILRRLSYTLPLSGHPVREFFVHLFYQHYSMMKVSSYDHPFSGGIGRRQ
jgi:radical SAM superfamily enzyme YgiQ (UPF0313 family)